jgi:gliding motility-associated-like protein
MKLFFTLLLTLVFTNTFYCQTFNSTGTANIPDGFEPDATLDPDFGAAVCVPITVAGVGNINTTTGLRSVCINITHPFVSDLWVYLRAPNGAYIPLSYNNGGSGADYTNTCFTMTASTFIFNGNAPFTGNFIPDYPLGWFNNNINANGVWDLCVQDGYEGDVGTINNWNITFGTNPAPYPITGCNGNLPASNFCQDATPICSLNGYCGNTSFVYSSYVWNELETVFSNCNLPLGASIENNSFIKFVASAPTASFNVTVSNSTAAPPNQGIQMMVFSGGCGSGPVTSYGCNRQMPPGVNNFTATGLTPGSTYFLMIDGFNGDVCDYSITATSGVNVLNITPAAPTYCTGAATGVSLTASGGNGTYTWSPAAGLSATSGATVIATPGATQTYTVTSGAIGSLNCPITKTVTVTVAPPPVVNAPTAVCVGNTVTLSPTTGGTWVSSNTAIATVTNAGVVTGVSAGSVTFTFTSTAGCSATTNSVTVSTATITPTFNAIAPICSGATAPVLPTTSTNGITGTWSPAVVSNTTSGTYIFTPNPGQCSNNATLNLTVTPLTTPTFNAIGPICSGATAPVLATTSNNGIAGTWNPATVSNTTSGTYTFTPNADLCASTAILNVTVNATVAPVINCGNSTATTVAFNWAAVTGATGYNITYTVNGGAVNNIGSIVPNTYTVNGLTANDNVSITVTPTGAGCFAPTSLTCIAVPCNAPSVTLSSVAGSNNQNICNNGTTPIATITYTIGGTATGATVSGLPAGVTGIYTTGVFTISGTPTANSIFNYTVTTVGGCSSAAIATGTITVSAPVTPTFAAVTPICTGATPPVLPTTSTNGILGTWNPATVNNTTSSTYTFTPNGGQCATTATLGVTVTSGTTPTFNPVTPICTGVTAPVLPTTSTNGFTGTWNPATVSNTASGTYTFTPTLGQCATTTTLQVTVNSPITPVFTPLLPVCFGATAPVLPLTSVNGITGTWSPATVSTLASAIYTFTPTAGQCATNFILPIAVITSPVVNLGNDTVVCNVPNLLLDATTLLSTYRWQDGSTNATFNVTQPGLYTVTVTRAGCSTTDFITVDFDKSPVFTLGPDQAICPGQSLVLTTNLNDPGLIYTWQDGSTNPTFTVTQIGDYFVDVENDCGITRSTVSVKQGLCKVFMPSAFTPNSDGANDVYKVGGGEFVSKFALSIFNRWGQKVFESTSVNKGWDGKLSGKSQSAGTYVYYVTYIDPTTDKEVKLRGTLMLIR